MDKNLLNQEKLLKICSKPQFVLQTNNNNEIVDICLFKVMLTFSVWFPCDWRLSRCCFVVCCC